MLLFARFYETMRLKEKGKNFVEPIVFCFFTKNLENDENTEGGVWNTD